MKRFDKDDYFEAQKYYEENGFVIIRDGIDAVLLNDFKEEFASVIKAYLVKAQIREEIDHESLFHRGMELLEKADHMYVAAIYDTIFLTPSFLRIVSQKSTVDAVGTFLEKQGVPLYGYTNRCLIAPPSDERRTYGWHQEVFYTVPRGSYIQTWAPLIANTSKVNGTIEVALGSHKEGIAKQKWNDIEGRATQIIVDDEIISKYQKLSVDMSLGELLYFSGHLAHRSGENISSEHRYSLAGMYHDVSAKDFITPSVGFNYRGETPKEYYRKVIGDS